MLFDPVALEAAADRFRRTYGVATPFPHAVIDGLLSEDLLDEVEAEFDAVPDEVWLRREIDWETKESLAEEASLPPRTAELLRACNSATFVRFLERPTGVEGLFPIRGSTGAGCTRSSQGVGWGSTRTSIGTVDWGSIVASTSCCTSTATGARAMAATSRDLLPPIVVRGVRRLRAVVSPAP